MFSSFIIFSDDSNQLYDDSELTRTLINVGKHLVLTYSDRTNKLLDY